MSSLEEQAVAPIRNLEEMGMPGDTAAARLRVDAAYARRSAKCFPTSGVTMGNIARALPPATTARTSPAGCFSSGKALDIRPLDLTEPDLQDLVAFLEGLTGVTEVQ